jgi:hypothetical protein
MVWDTFWAFFSQTHLVTLSPEQQSRFIANFLFPIEIQGLEVGCIYASKQPTNYGVRHSWHG